MVILGQVEGLCTSNSGRGNSGRSLEVKYYGNTGVGRGTMYYSNSGRSLDVKQYGNIGRGTMYYGNSGRGRGELVW